MSATATSAHEVTKTHFCKTPDCENQAKSELGRHSYCTPCQIKRGTANADGKPLAPGLGGGAVAPRAAAPAGGTHLSRVQALITSAKKLDKAEAKARAAMGDVKTLRARHAELLRDLGVTS